MSEPSLTSQRCRTTYHELLKLNDISVTDEALVKPKGPSLARSRALTRPGTEHLKLARIYFFERVGELRSSIFGGIEDYKCAPRIADASLTRQDA